MVEETKRESLTETAHKAIAGILKEGDIAIDATVGNGRDTEFLARLVGEHGKVYGFDIQERALTSARSLLAASGLMRHVTLFEAGHECMREMLPADAPGHVKVTMFNLGYLPGGSHDVTTMLDTTIAALDAALDLTSPMGIVSVMCYPGHPEGARECAGVEKWALALDGSRYETIWTFSGANTLKPPPRLLVISRKH